MPATYGHDVAAKYRVLQDFLDAEVTKHQLDNFPALRRNLPHVRLFAKALLYVGVLESIDRGQGICLRVASEAPGADSRPSGWGRSRGR